MLPTRAYAEAMKADELLLLPVPAAVVEQIAGRPAFERLH